MYYPKSQIKPNLFTNGDQYVYLRDETNYIGFYYSTSDGRYFTGKSPNNGPNFELIPVPVNINFVEAETLTPKNIHKTLKNSDAILVPGGFGERGIEGMILACKYAREKNS